MRHVSNYHGYCGHPQGRTAEGGWGGGGRGTTALSSIVIFLKAVLHSETCKAVVAAVASCCLKLETRRYIGSQTVTGSDPKYCSDTYSEFLEYVHTSVIRLCVNCKLCMYSWRD